MDAAFLIVTLWFLLVAPLRHKVALQRLLLVVTELTRCPCLISIHGCNYCDKCHNLGLVTRLLRDCYNGNRLKRADLDHLDEVIDCTHRGGTANGLCCARDPWAKPATDSISVERNVTEVCVFARPLAELAAPPTMRHHAETSTTTVADLMLADLRLSHHTLLQQFDRVFVEIWYKVREAAVLLFAAIDLLLRAMFRAGGG